MTKMKAWRHFRTITHHKILVMKGCFKLGLYRQGLLHDMSKYSVQIYAGRVYSGMQVLPGNEEPQQRGEGGKGILLRLATPQGAEQASL